MRDYIKELNEMSVQLNAMFRSYTGVANIAVGDSSDVPKSLYEAWDEMDSRWLLAKAQVKNLVDSHENFVGILDHYVND